MSRTSWPAIFALGFAIITSVAAVAVVVSRNVVRAVLYLVVVLAGIGVFFLIMGAEFIGWTQILVYVGAIVVLLLFGLMLTAAPIGRTALDNEQRGLALLAAGAVFGVFTWLIWDAFGDEQISMEQIVRTEDIGRSMFERFILPFELVSVLLLAALIGAIVLAKRDGE